MPADHFWVFSTATDSIAYASETPSETASADDGPSRFDPYKNFHFRVISEDPDVAADDNLADWLNEDVAPVNDAF